MKWRRGGRFLAIKLPEQILDYHLSMTDLLLDIVAAHEMLS